MDKDISKNKRKEAASVPLIVYEIERIRDERIIKHLIAALIGSISANILWIIIFAMNYI